MSYILEILFITYGLTSFGLGFLVAWAIYAKESDTERSALKYTNREYQEYRKNNPLQNSTSKCPLCQDINHHIQNKEKGLKRCALSASGIPLAPEWYLTPTGISPPPVQQTTCDKPTGQT